MLRIVLAVLLGWAVVIAGSVATCLAQESADDAVERQNIERFATILERNPRRGPAFDKVYGYHLERGSLDTLVTSYQQQAEQREGIEAAARWMIVGMIEAQRGHDPQAIVALTQAEQLQPANAMAPYYLGQLLALSGQTAEAADAMERAIRRKPAGADLMEFYQSLGRLYQRAQKRTEALGVWTRWEQQFPNDLRVQEQIATTLLEEEDFENALPRFEALVRATRDKYRQSQFQVEIAEIKIRQGKTSEGIKEFESLLSQLNPDNWLYRDVRRRIEAAYLKGNDTAGLQAYYEAWIDKHPEDLDAISRVAKLLIGQGNGNQAERWLQRGLKLAPSNLPLRRALITQLVNDRCYNEAIAQYVELDRQEPNNVDTIREWGRTILKVASRPVASRQQDAALVWGKLLAVRPDDAHAALQVADLFRHAEMTDDAIKLFRRAIELAPEDIQYREYLGEYLFTLKRKDEALSVWREIATGSRESAPNVARLAEVLAQYDQLPEAIDVSIKACRLDPKNLDLLLKHSALLSRAKRHEEALQHLASFQKLAVTEEERERWLQREVAELKSVDQLSTRILEVIAEQPLSAERWYWLARAYEVNGQPREALSAIAKSVEFDSQSIPMLVTAARLNESAHQLEVAIEIYAKLATLNRRLRTQYLRQIASLEERLGRREQALQAGRDLIAAAPANAEINEFFSQLCFRLGRKDEGIQTLRLALRSNPGDLPTLLRLANVLSNQHQHRDAVELLWRAFDRSRELADRVTVVEQLAIALENTNQLDSLYSRLARESRDPARHREMTICLAHAYEAAGNTATALKKLEQLVTDETRDTELLTYTRTLLQRQQDFAGAVRIQRQLMKVTGSDSERMQLVQLLLQAGNNDEAVELLITNAGEQQLTAGAMKLIDTLHHRGLTAQAIARVQALRRRFPDNWELLYREALLAKSSDEAKDLFVELLKLKLSADTPSLSGRSRLSQLTATSLPIIERLANLPRVRFALQTRKTQAAVYVSGVNRSQAQQLQQAQQNWDPIDYGEARMYALAWLAETVGSGFIDEKFPELMDSVSREQVVDQFVVHSILTRGKKPRDLARQLMMHSQDDVEAKILYLQHLTGQQLSGQQQPPFTLRQVPSQVVVSGTVQLIPGQGQAVKRLSSLDAKELDEAVALYREIAARPELVPYNVILLGGLTTELTLADRQSVVDELYANVARTASTRIEVAYLLFHQRASGELASIPALLDRLIAIEEQPVKSSLALASPYSTILQFLTPERLPVILQSRLQQSKDPDLLLAIWSRYVRLSARHAVLRPAAVGVWQLPIVVPVTNTGLNRRPPGTQPAQLQARNVVTANAVRMNQEMPAIVFDKSADAMLNVVTDQFRLSQRTDELVSKITQQVQNTTAASVECLYWQHTLADVLWSQNKRDEALAILAEASERFPQRQDLKFGLALQYEADRQMEKAFDVLETVTVNSTEERRALNSIRYRLAFAAAEPNRIRRLLERLAEEDVPDQQLVSVATEMVKYGQPDKAEAMLLRAMKNRRPMPTELRVLMDAQFAVGAMERASATALSFLKELDQSPAEMRNLRGVDGKVIEFQFDPAAQRLRCYQVLQASGQLTDLITKEETRIAEFKFNEDALNQLIALHQAAGHTKRAELLAIEKQKLNLSKSADRLSLALKYMETGLEYQAIDQLAILVESDPGFLAYRIQPTLEHYQSPEERIAFAELLLQLDWGVSNQQLAVLRGVIDQFAEIVGLESAATKLFLSMWDKHPERRIDLLQRFSDDRWWKLSEVQQRLSSVIVSDDANRSPTSWASFGRAVSRKDDFKVTGLTTVLNRWLSLAEANGNLDGTATEIEQKLTQTPAWTGGEAILALINLRRGRVAEGVEVLKQLRPKLEKVLRYREFMAWEIGGELVRHREGLDVGADYLTLAIGLNERHDWRSAASPGATLIGAYVKHGRSADARDLLLSQVPAGILTDTKDIVSTADFSQTVNIGSRLRMIGCPIDAIDLYVAAVRHGDATHGDLVGGLFAALRDLDSETFVKFVEELDTKSRPFSLHLFVKQDRLRTRWDILSKVARDVELRTRFLTALDRISDESTGKMAALTASAYLCFTADDAEKATLAVNKLIEADRVHPALGTEKMKSGPALDATGLWLVARECLTRKHLSIQGEKLGQRALEASKSLDREFKTAILKEWMLIAADAGDQAKCDLLAAELEKKP
ncbi:MAG: tetratricopeptide repeat protein [Schlesneria sp.]|nr:tetratricopeptide repeat protein [Schlesneria sp.]